MSDREWKSAVTDKKLEMLREDVQKIYNTVTKLMGDTDAIHRTVRQNDLLLKEVAKAIETIEKKLPKEAKGT